MIINYMHLVIIGMIIASFHYADAMLRSKNLLFCSTVLNNIKYHNRNICLKKFNEFSIRQNMQLDSIYNTVKKFNKNAANRAFNWIEFKELRNLFFLENCENAPTNFILLAHAALKYFDYPKPNSIKVKNIEREFIDEFYDAIGIKSDDYCFSCEQFSSNQAIFIQASQFQEHVHYYAPFVIAYEAARIANQDYDKLNLSLLRFTYENKENNFFVAKGHTYKLTLLEKEQKREAEKMAVEFLYADQKGRESLENMLYAYKGSREPKLISQEQYDMIMEILVNKKDGI